MHQELDDQDEDQLTLEADTLEYMSLWKCYALFYNWRPLAPPRKGFVAMVSYEESLAMGILVRNVVTD